MSKNLFLLFSFIALINSAMAQISQISTGAGYQKQTYYNLTTGTSKTVAHTTWDLAFSVYGQQDAGIFVNEAAGSSMGQSLPATEAYQAPTDNFSDVITAAQVTDRLYNTEQNWSYGALNELRDTSDVFDYGWGKYNFGTNTVEGKHVFVLKLRDGTYRKVEIQKLALTKYTFRHAALDGTDEKTITIDKKDFAGNTLAYFSFAAGKTVVVEPTDGFDLLFTRYSALLTQGPTTTQYIVAGILTNRGIQTAKAIGIDPKTVKVADYATKFSKDIDSIGHDWKSFNLAANKWEVSTNRAYFVKMKDQTIWKLVFTDFEGSATGTATFEKTNLGKPVAINENISNSIQYKVFPSTLQDNLNIAFDAPQSERIELAIINAAGRVELQQGIEANTGFQVFSLDASNLSTGLHFVRLTTKNGVAVAKVIKE